VRPSAFAASSQGKGRIHINVVEECFAAFYFEDFLAIEISFDLENIRNWLPSEYPIQLYLVTLSATPAASQASMCFALPFCLVPIQSSGFYACTRMIKSAGDNRVVRKSFLLVRVTCEIGAEPLGHLHFCRRFLKSHFYVKLF
jgi:hypothetical protein